MVLRALAVILTCIAVIAPAAASLADSEVKLFNGKDFSGWTKRGGEATYSIEDGEIVGRSRPNTPNTFLATDKEFGDFILELDFKIDPKDFNSGVQIRSHARAEGDAERVYGYQVEIDTETDRPWTGGIYYEAGNVGADGKWIRKAGWLNDLADNNEAQLARRLGEWNHLKIKAEGNRIQTWLNGVPAADFTEDDEKAFSPKGFIALQVHGVGDATDTKEIRWKNIKFTTLD
jgi:hypothetical protein